MLVWIALVLPSLRNNIIPSFCVNRKYTSNQHLNHPAKVSSPTVSAAKLKRVRYVNETQLVIKRRAGRVVRTLLNLIGRPAIGAQWLRFYRNWNISIVLFRSRKINREARDFRMGPLFGGAVRRNNRLVNFYSGFVCCLHPICNAGSGLKDPEFYQPTIAGSRGTINWVGGRQTVHKIRYRFKKISFQRLVSELSCNLKPAWKRRNRRNDRLIKFPCETAMLLLENDASCAGHSSRVVIIPSSLAALPQCTALTLIFTGPRFNPGNVSQGN